MNTEVEDVAGDSEIWTMDHAKAAISAGEVDCVTFQNCSPDESSDQWKLYFSNSFEPKKRFYVSSFRNTREPRIFKSVFAAWNIAREVGFPVGDLTAA